MQAAPQPTNIPEWTVSELSGALKRTLEDAFGHVRLRGEISNYRGPHASGHAYFCLKDRDARLDAVIWKTAFVRMKIRPEEGMEVVATGRITTFPGKSTYQIVVESIEPAGIGALMALVEERRRRLTAEGLFAEARKRRPPFLPGIVGIVTSPTGAVIRDILHRLEDRFPRHVLVWPVRVQGETCCEEVSAALAGFNAFAVGGPIPRPDVIIVARGGGSLEDLWAFNDEALVRAVAASAIPIISAIGHETDWTLIDHAADLRAPTPTGAAEMAVPVRSELVARVGALGIRHADTILRGVEMRRAELRSATRALPTPDVLVGARRQRVDLAGTRLAPALLANARDHDRRLRLAAAGLARHAPLIRLGSARTRLEGLGQQLRSARDSTLRAERVRLQACRERVAVLAQASARAARNAVALKLGRLTGQADLLASLGYMSVLARGYALVRGVDDRPIPRAAALAQGQAITIEFADGMRRAQAGAPRPRRRADPLAQASLFDI